MIKLKTAVLLAGSLKIGALAANAPQKDAQLLYDFGINIGMAFQLQDDYLDVFGNEKIFGKAIGNDIVSNKKTFLLISALNLAENNDKKLLIDALNNKFDKNKKIKTVTNLYKKLKVDELSKTKMKEYLNQALKLLENVSVEQHKKQELKNFALELYNRVS
jgi:geranylgeranyl diphosphate synthase type II